MKHVPIRLGPLALLLTVVAICMAVLGLLTFSTARADLAMAQKLAGSVRERYALEAEGQAFLHGLAAEVSETAPRLESLLPEGSGKDPKDLPRYGEPDVLRELEKDGDGVYWKELEQEGLSLRIGLKWDGKTNDLQVVCWQFSREWQAPEGIPGLWAGE